LHIKSLGKEICLAVASTEAVGDGVLKALGHVEKVLQLGLLSLFICDLWFLVSFSGSNMT
jgi:hypothetical protein